MDASGTPRLTCPHQLLVRVREIFKGDCHVDTSDLVQTLRRIGSDSPNLTDEANKLAEDVMKLDAPTHGNTMRRDVVAILMMLLKGRPDYANKHRKVKAFVYSLHLETLTELIGSTRGSSGECLTLSLVQQEHLLNRALGGEGVGENQEDGSDSAMQGVESMSSRIARMHVDRSVNQICAVKARKRLKNARQRIDKQYPYTMTWVVQDDIIDEFKAAGGKDENEAKQHAQRIWNHVCFPLEIWRTGGIEGTQGEFMHQWLKSGYTWDDSKAYLKTLTRKNDAKRELPEAFKKETMKRLRANIAETYEPRVQP